MIISGAEVADLRLNDVKTSERAGTVLVRQGKGLKEREIPLNASVRRAIRSYLEYLWEQRYGLR